MSRKLEHELTAREVEVARLVMEGLTDREIAQRLFIARRTAEWHVKQIFNKLGFNSRAQVAAWVARDQSVRTNVHSSDQHRHNLPLQLTTFVGREEELAEIQRLLATKRLVTLSAVGGAGKTRLALEAANRVLDSYSGGAWFVDLTQIKDASLVARAFGTTLGVHERPRQPMAETLIEYLKSLNVLLVADNCEHVLDQSAALIDSILRSCPGVAVLATSREPLRINGETVRRVKTLAVPDEGAPADPAHLARVEAVDLFVDRAQLVATGFSITPENASAIAELCRRLDGMPLALEMAAARAGSMSPVQMLERLGDRFGLLTAGNRAGPSRHRSLQSTLDWSYELLSDQERTVFRRLSVFAGSFALEAAEQICGVDLDATAVAQSVSNLVDKSLVVAMANGSAVMRFRLLEAVQHYGFERLTQGREVDLLNQRHCTFFVSLAERAAPHLHSRDRQAWQRLLALDVANFRAALVWSAKRASQQQLRISNALTFFWYAHGLVQEGDDWIKGAVREYPVRDELRAEALGNSGQFSFWRNDFAAASESWRQCLDLYRELGDRRGVARGLRWVAEGVEWQGDFTKARAYFGEALAIATEFSEERLVGNLYRHLGRLAMRSGDHDEARRHLEKSVSILEQIGDSVSLIWSIEYLGLDEVERGDFESARSYLKRAMAIAQANDLTIPTATVLLYFGALAAAQSDSIRALQLAGAADSVAASAGSVPARLTRSIVEGWLDRSRRQLGRAKAEACETQGAAMSRQQAIEYALNG